MSTNYDDILSRLKTKADQQQSDYVAQRQQSGQNYSNAINNSYDKQQQYLEDNANRQVGDVPGQYKSQYDQNAVQELIDRRKAVESNANMGAVNSGLQRVQQTAAGTRKQYADATTAQAIQSAIDKINQSKSDSENSLNLQRSQKLAEIAQAIGNDILNNYQNVQNNAASNASSIYNTDVTAEQAAADRALNQQVANAQLAEQQKETNATSGYNAAKLEADQKQAQKQIAAGLIQALITEQGYTPEAAVAAILGNGVNYQDWLNK